MQLTHEPSVRLGLAAICLTAHVCAPSLVQAGQKTFGWIEEGLVYPDKVATKFKLDTGALTSSMHAEMLERFEKDGENWVRFTLEFEDIDSGKDVETRIERRVERNLKVRGAGGAETRPVVLTKVCLGDKVYEEEFSLNDRDKMNYPVLLGRRTLGKLGLVDTTKTFTVEPSC